MDATQKRRMWKVAIAHFVLTLIVWLNWERLESEDYIQSIVWADSWKNVFFLLQPQIWLVFWGEQFSILRGIYSFISDAVAFGICLLLIPIWSICFAWIFVKLDNWLNHFPVLGKRVF